MRSPFDLYRLHLSPAMSSSRAASSVTTSSKPNTAIISRWVSSEKCADLTTNYRAIRVKLLSHKMLIVEPCAKMRHHAVMISLECVICQRKMWRTYEFSSA
ncbi:hypothetical protein niasHT_021465 [Heterodera trifolii]|uniref:Uncharacterized protein n=1 Tax=Heterodera trifolii TaxID=157864 RepID=A0ABD2KIN5_9BILA